ncbi:hypothetical protein QBC37DRAFT_447654 [Rhypophila decipiens]|uniref:Uncharacterized protein n=1 Tax=Rhypophila decipiens TaxID=261697 RepID=A0AAN7B784_9PEZI|nr:hypothetical protein QBC37DRAFT_447654 [Rhypophila decipiens]
MTTEAQVTKKFDSLKLDSESDREVEGTHKYGIEWLKDASWRENIPSLPEYKIINKMQVVAEDDSAASVDETVSAIVELTKQSLQTWAEKTKVPSGSVIDSMKKAPTRHVAATWTSVLELAMTATNPEFLEKLLEFSTKLMKTDVKPPTALHKAYLASKNERLWTSRQADLGYYLWTELVDHTDTQVYTEPDFLSAAQQSRLTNLVTLAAKYVRETTTDGPWATGMISWAISQHIAPVIEPAENDAFEPELPESLVQAACIWLSECAMPFWEKAVHIDDDLALRGYDPHDVEELDTLRVVNVCKWNYALEKFIGAQNSKHGGNKFMQGMKKLSKENFELLCNANLDLWLAMESGVYTDEDIDWRKIRDERLREHEEALRDDYDPHGYMG